MRLPWNVFKGYIVIFLSLFALSVKETTLKSLCKQKRFPTGKLKTQIISGAPGEIRTPDPLIRSQILYPAELRAHNMGTGYTRADGQIQGVLWGPEDLKAFDAA